MIDFPVIFVAFVSTLAVTITWQELSRRMEGMEKTLQDQAEEAGRWAREAGRSIEKCPSYGLNDADSIERRRRWRLGWERADREIRSGK